MVIAHNKLVQRNLKPQWVHQRCIFTGDIPEKLQTWLLYRESTSKRFRQLSPNGYRVQVVSHRWQQPNYDEIQSLNLSSREVAIVRESIMICDQRRMMYARCIFPRHVLMGKGAELRRLSEKPLGDILFAGRNLHRSEFSIAKLRAGNNYYRQACQFIEQCPDMLWARRSRFYLNNSPLLVTEVFLPDIYHLKE